MLDQHRADFFEKHIALPCPNDGLVDLAESGIQAFEALDFDFVRFQGLVGVLDLTKCPAHHEPEDEKGHSHKP